MGTGFGYQLAYLDVLCTAPGNYCRTVNSGRLVAFHRGPFGYAFRPDHGHPDHAMVGPRLKASVRGYLFRIYQLMKARATRARPGPFAEGWRGEGACWVSVRAFGVLFRRGPYIASAAASGLILGYWICTGICSARGSRSVLSPRPGCSRNRAVHPRTGWGSFAGKDSIIAGVSSPPWVGP